MMTSSPDPSVSPSTACTAHWDQGFLTLANCLFREVWRSEQDGQLRLVSFQRAGGIEWVSKLTPARPAPNADPLSAVEPSAGANARWAAEFDPRPVGPHSATAATQVELRFRAPDDGRLRVHQFWLHPAVAGSVHRTTGSEIDAALRDCEAGTSSAMTGWLRTKPNGQVFVTLPEVAHPLFELSRRHLRVREISFVDQSDHHSNFVFEREYLTHPGERCLPLRSNLVCLEAPDTGEGFLWLLLAPLPAVRSRWSAYYDFLLAFQAGRLVASACPLGYSVARVAYTGGRAGATCALHELQRAFYRSDTARSGLILSNTWGDRAGAAHLSDAFVRAEITAASRLGVEVVQIDDGWQKGATVNTVSSGGVWNGFWAADPHFWTPHAQRFRRGLRPLADAARDAGVQLGLWYAPDSTHDLANWEKDAARILELWREYDIAFFKLDAVKLHSRLAETRFHALCDRVQAESGNAVFFDFDATAEHRPTYWGRPGSGALFLENRFTEQAGYHPHQTLRALWTLSHYVRPERLRIEFLNPSRNDADYGDDPLRPSCYPTDYLLAVTLPGAPLAWMELSKVPEETAGCWRRLLEIWKHHRRAFQAGQVLPVGQPPSGFSWTGFVSLLADDAGPREVYGLFFREHTKEDYHEIELPAHLEWPRSGDFDCLAGTGTVSVTGGARLRVQIPASQAFVLARWVRE